MAQIEFSKDFASAMIPRLMQNGGVQSARQYTTGASQAGLLVSPSTSNWGSDTVGMRFCIMKGTVPTNFTSLTNFDARSADLLASIEGTNNTYVTPFYTASNVTVNPIILNSSFVTATAAGTATWFWWVVQHFDNNPNWNNTDPLLHQMIGTCGAIGSGADLTIVNPVLAVGDLVRVLNFRIEFPTIYHF